MIAASFQVDFKTIGVTIAVEMIKRGIIKLTGVVQGVGFRPFVHRLSLRFRLNGRVRNTSSGAQMEIEGTEKDIRGFYRCLDSELPPLARITGKSLKLSSPKGYRDFRIVESKTTRGASALISPDIGLCPACEKELFDPRDRRFRYPFINCTDCGPRFSIIESLPYDRCLTTMRKFRMCPQCRKEYADIADRRYHAQPDACPSCGPQLLLLRASKNGRPKTAARGKRALTLAVKALKQGRIICVKGISGFHIACDASNAAAVKRLRARKRRPYKPFALMVKDIPQAKELCEVCALEEKILLGPERPIVLLRKKPGRDALGRSRMAELLSPDNNCLGIMMPYAPLHYLLFDGKLTCLVMTSANEADEPVEAGNIPAFNHLKGVCDLFLLHDRDIANRADDSIIQVIDGKPVAHRRGRGYSPFPFFLGHTARQVLACGAELKNTFCLTKGDCAFLSQYIGDLKTYSTFVFYKEAIARLSRLFRVKPERIAFDLHPDYLSTRYAQERLAADPRLKPVAVQHHKAHAASVIAEHALRGPVIAVCYDGIGYGEDGKIWGGELFCGNLKKMERLGSLEYIPMPGGDKATQEPFRMAVSWLYKTFGEKAAGLPIGFVRRHRAIMPVLARSCARDPVLTSSCGRLFDAVSALLGFCDIITYEAQAAIRLQTRAERSRARQSYPFALRKNGRLLLDPAPCIRALVKDIQSGTRPDDCARKFHNGLALATARACVTLRGKTGIRVVCLSGGVFQNKLLLETLLALLRARGFRVYFNQLLPANDGAVSLGQAVIASAK